jgi:hypothetical protein
MLSLSTSNKVTFNVNVSGTAATPSVRCLIGEHPSLSFPATKLSNDEWEVIIDLPAGTKPGAHPFKVEVLLNGRLFTPINYSIDVSADDAVNAVEPVQVVAPVQVAQVEPVQSVPVPVQDTPKSNLMSMVSKITEPEPTPNIAVSERTDVAVHDSEPAVKAEAKPIKRPKPAAAKPTPIEIPPSKMNGLEKLAKTPVFSKPKPVIEAKHVKISMLDIANEVNKNAAPVVAKPKPIQEARVQSIPVSLTKGTVIYR